MSLDLDERQRAMLQEMHVQVWWPPPSGAEALARAPEPVPAATTAPLRSAGATPRVAAAPAPLPVVEPVPGGEGNLRVRAAPNPPAPGVFAHPHDLDIATLNWAALQQAVSVCRACPLCETRKSTVFGVGGPPAEPQAVPQVDWLIVGEAPDEEEDRTGEPFAGQGGQLLDNMLRAMALGRQHQVFLTPVVKCRPPGNRNPEPAEIAQCEPFLRRQIALLQPKIILAMGRFAAVALLQDSVPDVRQLPPGKLRVRLHHYASAGRKVPVVATFSPNHLLRNQAEKAKAWADLCFAMDALRSTV